MSEAERMAGWREPKMPPDSHRLSLVSPTFL